MATQFRRNGGLSASPALKGRYNAGATWTHAFASNFMYFYSKGWCDRNPSSSTLEARLHSAVFLARGVAVRAARVTAGHHPDCARPQGGIRHEHLPALCRPAFGCAGRGSCRGRRPRSHRDSDAGFQSTRHLPLLATEVLHPSASCRLLTAPS